MSQDLRSDNSGESDISRTATEGTEQKNFEGFEGMNYEQIRPPYNPQYKGRRNTTDQRNSSKRPDEA